MADRGRRTLLSYAYCETSHYHGEPAGLHKSSKRGLGHDYDWHQRIRIVCEELDRSAVQFSRGNLMDRVERPSFPPLPITEKENDGITHSDTVGCCDSDELRDDLVCRSADPEPIESAPATDKSPRDDSPTSWHTMTRFAKHHVPIIRPTEMRRTKIKFPKLIAISDDGAKLFQTSAAPGGNVQLATGYIELDGHRLGAAPDMLIGSILAHCPTTWILVESERRRRAAVDVVLRGEVEEGFGFARKPAPKAARKGGRS